MKPKVPGKTAIAGSAELRECIIIGISTVSAWPKFPNGCACVGGYVYRSIWICELIKLLVIRLPRSILLKRYGTCAMAGET